MKRYRIVLLAIALLVFGSSLQAELTTGNLVVSVNEFTGSANDPRYVAEFSTDGTRIQRFQNLPLPESDDSLSEFARNLVVLNGSIYVYNGTDAPTISELASPSPGSSWTQPYSAPEWNTIPNVSFGGLDAFGNYLFATDMKVDGDAMGVVRFDTSDGTWTRFGVPGDDGTDPRDLAVDASGKVYALSNNPLRQIDVFDGLSGEAVDSVTLTFDDWRALDVALDGTIYVASWNGDVTRFSAAGSVLDTVNVTNKRFNDIDINHDTGQIALGTGNSGEVYLTDLSLDSFSSFRATESVIGGDAFVSWVGVTAIPEPSSVLPCALLTTGLWVSRRRRKQ